MQNLERVSFTPWLWYRFCFNSVMIGWLRRKRMVRRVEWCENLPSLTNTGCFYWPRSKIGDQMSVHSIEDRQKWREFRCQVPIKSKPTKWTRNFFSCFCSLLLFLIQNFDEDIPRCLIKSTIARLKIYTDK